jgi:acetyl esterase/lipase
MPFLNQDETSEEIAKLAEPDPEFTEVGNLPSLCISTREKTITNTPQLLATTPQPTLEISYPVVQILRQRSLAIERERTALAISSGRHEETRSIPMRDGFSSEIRIHRPKSPPATGSPLVVLIFGGGFFMGNCLQMGSIARALTDLHGATVVCISYRLAPEFPWPQAHYDGWDSLLWIADNASSLGASTSAGFVLGGSSAGGNIAAVLAQKSLAEPLAAPLTGLWMDVSMLFANPENCPEKYKPLYLSHTQNENAPGLLSKQAIAYIRSASKGDGSSPDFSPINAENAHVGMPRTFMQAAGMDSYRDDSVIYACMLKEHGVDVRLKVYPGVPHGHANIWPGLRVSREAKVDTLEGLGWLLRGEVEGEEGREKISAVMEAVAGPDLGAKHKMK